MHNKRVKNISYKRKEYINPTEIFEGERLLIKIKQAIEFSRKMWQLNNNQEISQNKINSPNHLFTVTVYFQLEGCGSCGWMENAKSTT